MCILLLDIHFEYQRHCCICKLLSFITPMLNFKLIISRFSKSKSLFEIQIDENIKQMEMLTFALSLQVCSNKKILCSSLIPILWQAMYCHSFCRDSVGSKMLQRSRRRLQYFCSCEFFFLSCSFVLFISFFLTCF